MRRFASRAAATVGALPLALLAFLGAAEARAQAAGPVPEKLTGTVTYEEEYGGDDSFATTHFLEQATVEFEAVHGSTDSSGRNHYLAGDSSGSFTFQGEERDKRDCKYNHTWEGSGAAPPFESFTLWVSDAEAYIYLTIPGKTTYQYGGSSDSNCPPGQAVSDDSVDVFCSGTLSQAPDGAFEIDFTGDANGRKCGGELTGHFDPLHLDLDGAESGPDEVTLFSLLRNASGEGPITDLSYPGGSSAGLIANTAPYEPERRGAVVIERGPLPTLPGRLEPGAQSAHAWTLSITQPGVVMVRAEAEGSGPDGVEASDTDFVEVEAVPRELTDEQKRAILAGAYMDLLQRARDGFDAELTKALKKLEKKVKGLGKKQKKDLKRSTPQEDLLAELYGLPAGSLDFLPDSVKSGLTFAKARKQHKQKAWKKNLVDGVEKYAYAPLEFWDNQIFGSDPTTKFQVGQEIWNAAEEQAGNFGSFMGDAWSLLDSSAPEEIAAGMPILVDEYGAKIGKFTKDTVELGTKQATKFARAFDKGDLKGVKASAEWFAEKEVAVEAAVAKEVILEMGTGGLALASRAKKTVKAIETLDDLPLPRSSLNDLLPRTIDDGLLPPSAAELGMSVTDQKLIGDVLASLEQKAARMGYPDLDLEAAFRSRGYSAPGAIGKNQYMKGKTGAVIDLLLGMHKKGLGNNVIYKPKLPKALSELPSEIQALIRQRFDDQLSVFEGWQAAKKGKKSKQSELFKATGKKGNTFQNVLENGAVTDETFMKLKVKKAGDTEILLYEDLVVNGTKVVKGKPTPIGSDYDGLYLGLKGGADIPAGVRGALWLEANQQFTKLARDKGFAWGFHGLSRNGFEFSSAAYHGKIWEYVAEALPESEALRIFGNKGTDVLEKMTFGQYAVKVTKDGASTGPINP